MTAVLRTYPCILLLPSSFSAILLHHPSLSLSDVGLALMVWESTPGTDIFSLGSTIYTIVTGHWPYKSAHSSEEEEDKWDL
jgi:hypothetical protein